MIKINVIILKEKLLLKNFMEKLKNKFYDILNFKNLKNNFYILIFFDINSDVLKKIFINIIIF